MPAGEGCGRGRGGSGRREADLVAGEHGPADSQHLGQYLDPAVRCSAVRSAVHAVVGSLEARLSEAESRASIGNDIEGGGHLGQYAGATGVDIADERTELYP